MSAKYRVRTLFYKIRSTCATMETPLACLVMFPERTYHHTQRLHQLHKSTVTTSSLLHQAPCQAASSQLPPSYLHPWICCPPLAAPPWACNSLTASMLSVGQQPSPAPGSLAQPTLSPSALKHHRLPLPPCHHHTATWACLPCPHSQSTAFPRLEPPAWMPCHSTTRLHALSTGLTSSSCQCHMRQVQAMPQCCLARPTLHP
ncbi:hypothetical protein V8C86DRAFT_2532097 [Haematococcus lacustris]